MNEDVLKEIVWETYWGSPAGNIHRMSGDQEIVATVTESCTSEEWQMFCNVKLVERSSK